MNTKGYGSARRFRSIMVNALVLCLSLILVLLLVALVDRTVGRALLVRSNTAAFVFDPGTRFGYDTNEFSFVARINQLGFRDRDFEFTSQKQFRIVAIGDSFTFGYGVADTEPWPKALERKLQAEGVDVEVLNLGRPGAGPRFYESIAADAIPLLKPNLVLVGVLAGDDLYSCYRGDSFHGDIPLAEFRSRPLHIASKIAPYLTQMAVVRNLRSDTRPDQELIDQARANQIHDARRFLENWTAKERGQFHELDDDIQALYEDGRINPYNVRMGIKNPDFSASVQRRMTILTHCRPSAVLFFRNTSRRFVALRRNMWAKLPPCSFRTRPS